MCLTRGELVQVERMDEGASVDPTAWCKSCLRDETACLDLEVKLLDSHADASAGASGDRWDAEAGIAVGAFIRSYLDENPPPGNSRYAGDFDKWGRSLECEGKHRLLDLDAGEEA